MPRQTKVNNRKHLHSYNRVNPIPRSGIRINMAITVTPTRIRCMTPGNVDGAPTGSIGKMLLEKRWLIPTVNKKMPPTVMDLD
jgi:hypothetical protein